MSEAKRAYDLMRGYVNREWDRIKGLEMLDALRELDSPLSDKQSKLMDHEKAGSGSQSDSTRSETVSSDGEGEQNYEVTARLILGVHANADFKEIRAAFEKINRRSQPENFDEGSEEADHAHQVLRRATWAYNFLTKDMSASDKRFQSLELE